LDVGVLSSTPSLIECFPDVYHVLFEPVAEWNSKIGYAYRNIEHDLFNIALSDRTGESFLALSSVKPGQTTTHGRLSDANNGRRVETSTMDDFLSSRTYRVPYFLKVDVDGAELAILSGAKNTLPHCSAVMVEVNVNTFFQRISTLAGAFTLFDIVDLCYYDERLAQFDLIFLNTALSDKLGLALYPGGRFDLTKWVAYSRGLP
jgi:FkbM family methyltransferase